MHLEKAVFEESSIRAIDHPWTHESRARLVCTCSPDHLLFTRRKGMVNDFLACVGSHCWLDRFGSSDSSPHIPRTLLVLQSRCLLLEECPLLIVDKRAYLGVYP